VAPLRPKQVTRIKATIPAPEEAERCQSRQHQRPGLPSPLWAVVAIATAFLEVQAGARPPWHLDDLSHYSLWRLWPALASSTTPMASLPAPRPLAVTMQEHIPGLVDATAVLAFAGRVEPVSLRLDSARGRWEVIELEYASRTPLFIATPRRALDVPVASSSVRTGHASTRNADSVRIAGIGLE
jgi:hypothetical protein